MTWLWIILRWLFPSDEVRQGVEGLKQMVGHMAGTVFTEDWIRAAENDPALRLYLEEMIIDYEEGLSTMIGARACQIAKLPFHPPHKSWYRPSRAKPLVCLMLRLSDLVEACLDLERRAQVRAGRLQRERDADPLGLSGHDHAGCIEPRRKPEEMRHRATRTTGWCMSRCSVRPTPQSCVQTARGPPPAIVSLHPQAASQPHLRGQERMRKARVTPNLHLAAYCQALRTGMNSRSTPQQGARKHEHP